MNKALTDEEDIPGMDIQKSTTSEWDPWFVYSFNEDEVCELLRNDTLQSDYMHVHMSYNKCLYLFNAWTQKDHWP